MSQTQPLGAATLASCTNHLATQYAQETGDQPRVRSGNLLLVYVGDGSGTLGAAGVSAIKVSVYPPNQPTGTQVTCADSGSTASPNLANSYFWPCWIESGAASTQPFTVSFPDAAQNDTIDVAVTAGTTDYHRFGRFTQPLSWASNASGFWIPIGLFGTDFHANSDGITLAALPVGVAWGGQYNFSGTNYLGLSIILDWTIAPQKTDGTNSGNYTLSAGSLGGIVDLDGYVYLGYAYAADVRALAGNSGYTNPGSMFVVGVGPKLLEVLKSAGGGSK